MNRKRLTLACWLGVIVVAVCVLVTQAAVADDQGAVYGMTNALGKNQIKVWARAADGTLTLTQTIATGGGGSGTQLDPADSLGSEGGLVLDRPHRHLFAVNTETLHLDPVGADIHDCQVGSISSFLIAADGSLTLADRVPSGGLFPNSLTVQGNQLYVLNAGGPGISPSCGVSPNITGFKVSPDGRLSPIPDSTRTIDPGTSPGSFLNCDPGGGPFPTSQFRCGLNPPAFPRSPSQIGFAPEGDALIVTVKGPNTIYVFPFDDGSPGVPTIFHAPGPFQPTYFGFAFDLEGRLIVTEPFGATATIPAVPKSAASSFALSEGGALHPISSDVPNGRGTSCWVVVDPLTGRFAYVGNNATSDVSSYVIGEDGSLTLLAATAGAGNLPNDLAVAKSDGQSFLYMLNGGNGTVGAFRINRDGSLTSLGAFGGLPAKAGAQGLAAF